MEERNLYAPPKAQIVATKDTTCTRDGDSVVVQIGNDLPPRCIICNAPVKGPVKATKLYWHSPWLYLLILINILVYAVIGIFVRRSIKISPGLCEAHLAKRRRRILIFLGIGGGAICVAIFMLTVNEWIAAAFFVLALLLLIVGMLASRKVYARKITEDYARLGGCKEPFLASLE